MTTSQIAGLRRTRFDGGGYLFKQAAVATFVFGFYLHAVRLQIGDDTIVTAHVITPGADQVFAVLMGYAAIAGWLSRRWVSHPTRRHKVVFSVVLVYITASLPLHVASFFTKSTELFMVFPLWYSGVFLAMVTAMIVFIWRLEIRRPVTGTPQRVPPARPWTPVRGPEPRRGRTRPARSHS